MVQMRDDEGKAEGKEIIAKWLRSGKFSRVKAREKASITTRFPSWVTR